MITIHPTGIEIHIKSNQPASDYVETVNDLITILQKRNKDEPSNDYYAFELLRAMIPSCEQARIMFDDNCRDSL